MRPTLRYRIVLTVAPLIALLAVLGGAGALLLYRLGGSIDLILRENYRSIIAMKYLNESLERMDSSFQFALAGRPEQAREQFEQNLKIYLENLTIEQHNVTLPGEQELVTQLTALSDEYRQRGTEFHDEAARDGSNRKERYFGAANHDGLLTLFEQIKRVSGQISQINHENMELASRRSRQLATRSLIWFGIGLAAAVATALLLAFHTIRTILRPIQSITHAARGISEGNLNQLVPYIAHDELGELADVFNAMARHLRESRESTSFRLLRARQASQASIDSFPDPILMVDSEGRVEMANPAAQRLLGVVAARHPHPQVSGISPMPGASATLPWQPPEPLRQPLAAALHDQRPYLPERFDQAISIRVDGKDSFFLPRILPVRDHQNNTLGAAILLQDVTRFRLLDEIKSNLVATVSHELKTPMTSIQLDIHVLLDETVGPLTPKQIEFLMDARENSELLLGRVNNLLDLTRLERGREQLDIQPAQPCDLLRDAADAIRPKTEDKGIVLELDAPSDLPRVAADVTRLQHALGNILENAVTYTERGGRIKLSATLLEPNVVLSISDTGSGIPAEHLPHVFERFFRVPGQNRGSGTGLGLAIAREIVTAHAGTITCESQPGMGTAFRLTLPVWHVAAADASPRNDSRGSRGC